MTADATQPGSGSRVLRGQFTLLLSSLAQLVFSIVTVALVGRWLSPAGFALFALIGAIFSICRDLLDLGSTGVATRLLASRPQDARSIIGATMLWRTALAILGAGAVTAAAASLGPREERPLIIAAALALLTSVSGAFNALFNARHHQSRPAIASILVQGGAALAALLALKAAHAPESAAAWLLVAREVAWWIVIAALGVNLLGSLPTFPRAAAFRPVVVPGLTFGAAVLLHQLLVQGDVPLTRWTLGPESTAAIAASSRPIGAMVALPWIAAAPLIAAVATLRQLDPAACVRLVRRRRALGFSTGLLVAILGQSAGASILKVLYADAYISDPHAVIAARAACIVLGGAIAAAAPTMALVAAHRERWLLTLSILVCAAAALGKFFAIRNHDVGKIAIVTAIAEWLLALGGLFLCRREFTRLPAPAAILTSLTLAAVGLAALSQIAPGSPARLALGLLFGLAGLVLLARSPAAREYRVAAALAGESTP